MKQRTVFAYAGSVDATRRLRELTARHRGDVVTLTVDLGQGGELEQVREAALACGAARAHVIDARGELARDYALPVLRGGLPPDAAAALVRSLGDAVVSAKLAEIAAIEQATIHEDTTAHAVEATILGRIVNAGARRLTRDVAAAPDAPAVVTITFAAGVPVAVNDVALPLLELIESLATIAGQHGVGRVGDVDAPAAVVLAAALHAARDGDVRLKLFKGTCEHVPELVTHT